MTNHARKSKQQVLSGINALRSFNILHRCDTQHSNGDAASSNYKEMYELDAVFQKNLAATFSGKAQQHQTTHLREVNEENAAGAPAISTLNNYAESSWEMLLSFVLGEELEASPSEPLTATLIHAGIIADTSDGLSLTAEGYQYVLRDTYSQVWTLLITFVAKQVPAEFRQEVLSFVFQISFLSFGKCYSMESVTKYQKQMLNLMREIGIIYKRHNEKSCYITRLATTLSEGFTEDKEDDSIGAGSAFAQQGFLVVETNYRLYAYTSSAMEIARLELFCRSVLVVACC